MTTLIRFYLLVIFWTGCYTGPTKTMQYPETRKNADVTDTYFTTTVSDPYRWLEDDNSDETMAWVQAQNKITFGYLDNISQKEKIKNRLTEIWDY